MSTTEKTITATAARETNYVGQITKIGGQLYRAVRLIESHRFTDGLSMGHRIDDGVYHKLACLPLSADEITEYEAAIKMAELEKQLKFYSHEPDDFRQLDEWSKKRAELVKQIEAMKA